MGTKNRASLLLPAIVSLLVSCGNDSAPPSTEKGANSADLGLGLPEEQDPKALVQEALGFLQLNNAPRARDLLLSAIALDEGLAEAHHFLGRTLMGMSRVEAGHDGGAGSVGLSVDGQIQKQGVAAMRRATELAPNEADYFYWLGRGLHLMRAHGEAAEALKQAIALDSQHGMAHKRLGITYLDSGQTKLALESFSTAADLLPSDPGPPFQVGNLLLEEDPEGARDAFRRAISADISYPGAYNGLIAVLNRLGDPDGSAQAAADFAKWNDFEANLQGLLGRAQNRQSDIDAQLDVADQMLIKQDWEAARDYFVRAIMLDASSDYAHMNLGLLNQRLGDDETALMHFEETIHLQPTAFEPRLQLALVCQRLGRLERMQELLAVLQNEADKLDTGTRLRMGLALQEAGLSADAEWHYRALLEAEPGNVKAQDGLKLLLEATSNE